MSVTPAPVLARLLSGATLERTPAGRLRLTTPDGVVHEPVLAVRAFPISAPERGLSLMSAEGHELFWIEQISALEPAVRSLVQEALDEREFMPVIAQLLEVSGFVTPCTWRVDTDRGPARFVLKGEEDIRRLSANTLIVADAHGVQFLIRHLPSMDRQTRKLLDRFM